MMRVNLQVGADEHIAPSARTDREHASQAVRDDVIGSLSKPLSAPEVSTTTYREKAAVDRFTEHQYATATVVRKSPATPAPWVGVMTFTRTT